MSKKYKRRVLSNHTIENMKPQKSELKSNDLNNYKLKFDESREEESMSDVAQELATFR